MGSAATACRQEDTRLLESERQISTEAQMSPCRRSQRRGAQGTNAGTCAAGPRAAPAERTPLGTPKSTTSTVGPGGESPDQKQGDRELTGVGTSLAWTPGGGASSTASCSPERKRGWEEPACEPRAGPPDATARCIQGRTFQFGDARSLWEMNPNSRL